MLTISGAKISLSKWLTYLLVGSLLSIIPSALWLPTSPANAATQDSVYSNVTLPNSTSLIAPSSTTAIGGSNWLNTTNLTSGVIVYVALRNPSSSDEYFNFSSWTGVTVVDDWFNGAAPGTSNTTAACSSCSAAYTTQGNFQNIIFTATSASAANTALASLQLITPATVGTPYIWVGASASDSSYKYYWATRHFYHYNSNLDTYANDRNYAQTYPSITTSANGLSGTTSNGYVGQSGYLATIVDAGENSVAGSANGANNSWIGLSDQYQEGVFEWDRNGGSPEAGSVMTYANTCGVTTNSHTASPYTSGIPDLTFTSPSGCGGSTGMTSYTAGYTQVAPSSYSYTNGYGNHSGNAFAGSNASGSTGYSNWSAGEPNNASSSNAENAAELYGSANSYKWNDLYVGTSLGYTVEFGSAFNDFAGSQPGPGMSVMAITSSGATATGGLSAVDLYMGEKNTTTVNTGASNQSNEIVTQGQDSNNFFGGSAPAITTNQLICGANFTQTNFAWSSAGADTTANSTCSQATEWIQHDYGYFTVPGKYDGSTTASVTFELAGKDDGVSLSVGGIVSMLGTSASGYALSCWSDGCTQSYTALTLYVGRSYPVDLWYYNNTGGAALDLTAVISTFNSGAAVHLNTTYGAQMFSTTPRFISMATPSGASLTATAGTAYSLSVTASGAIGTVSYTYTGTLPNGLNFNTSTGVISGTATIAGSSAITVSATDANGATVSTNSFTISVVAGALSAQAKTQVISSSSPSGARITTQPIITLVDANNNTITTDNGNVTASIYSGANGTLGGTKTVAASSGVATFTNLVLNGVNGTAYVLQFTHTGTPNIYETLTATTGAATQVALGTPVSSTTAAGALLSPQPIAYIEDSAGNIVNTTASVQMAISSGTGGSITGTATISAVAGTATFSGISIGGVAGTQYGLLFSSGSLSSASANITVYAGSANSIALTTQPAGYPNGAPAIVQPVVSLTDAFGNIANYYSDTITATVSTGATLTGTTSVATASGSATFANLGVSGTPGSQYTLTFTNSLTNKTVAQTQVVPGSATDTAMTFDGSTTYGITSSLSTTQLSNTNFTSEAWAYPAANSCSSNQIVWLRSTLGGTGSPNYSWSLFCLSNNWYAGYYNTNTSAWGNLLLGPVETGQWQHLAFSYASSGTSFLGYFNGINTISTSLTGATFNTGSSPIEVGGNGSGSQNFNGMIDELKLWNVVRTSTQIAADMNTWGPVAANNNLAIYFDFNDVTTSTIFDKAWGSVTAENLSMSGSYSLVDMKSTQTCKLSNHTCVAFNRTYLNPFGGYQVPTSVTSASVLVIAGGGGGTAQSDSTGLVGGGGGAGGYQVFNNTTLTPSAYLPVIVGGGGYGGVVTSSGWGLGQNGTNSQFGSLTASVGGGAGGGVSASSGNNNNVNAASGGSGGGGGTYYTSTGGHGASGTSGQGNSGGNALGSCCASGGGGGSAGVGGTPSSASSPALGGDGTVNPFVGSAYVAAGGNGAGSNGATLYTIAGSAKGSTVTGASAAANTGSGGGGGGGGTPNVSAAGAGGSGLILLEYVTALPIVANPINESATVGVTTTFFDTNTALTGLTRTFTWQYSSNGGTTWATAPNGTATYGTPSGSAGAGQVLANGSYVTPTLNTTMNNYQYRVIVVDTDSFGVSSTTTTSAASLTVNPAIRLIGTPGSAVYGVRTGDGTAGYIQVQTGTGTGPFTFALNPPSSQYSIDTSTASYGFVNLISLTSPVGTYVETITVTDSSGASATGIIPISITAAPTSTSFLAGAAFYNQPDTLTATVAQSTVLTTAGTVTFKDSSNNVLCTTSVFNASNQASCAWTPASTNTYLITAYFQDGAGNFASSISGTTSISPGKASITESVAASTAVVAGATGANALQLTATLNPTGSVSPAGTVAFTVNGANACLAASVSNSIATCSYSALGAGIQSISAVYSGDSTFNGANASTTTTISACNVTSTGLTYTTSAPVAGYCLVSFTAGSSGTWTTPSTVVNAQLLVVGGGGGGAGNVSASSSTLLSGGGGGGGGGVFSATSVPLPGSIAISVGAAGAGGHSDSSAGANTIGARGGSSAFSAITAGGGGGGGCPTNSPAGICPGTTSQNGGDGTASGSGGGASNIWAAYTYGAAGTASSATIMGSTYSGVSGKIGGAYVAGSSPTGGSGSGGGAGSAGAYNAPGAGVSVAITGTATTYGAGGAAYGVTGGLTYAANASGYGTGGTGAYLTSGAQNGGAGAPGVVIVKYLSPSIITTNWDTSGDTMTVTSGTSLTLVETATVFSFTRTTSWQYSVDGGTTWNLETATATSGANSSIGNGSPTLSYTFVIRCGLNTGTCKSATTQYLFRAMVIDTDTVTNLVTDSFSPTITVNVTALPFASLLTIISTSATYIANSPFTLFTAGGGGTGAITYALSGTGTATGCSISGATLRTTSSGNCRVIAVQAGDFNYIAETTTVTTISFYTYISYVNQYTAPVGSHGIGGGVSGGGINNTQTTGSTVITVTGMTPTSGAAQTLIVVTGTNFQTGGTSNIASISFNFGLDPVSFVVNSPTQLTITLPSGETGVVDQFAIQPVNGVTVYTTSFTGL